MNSFLISIGLQLIIVHVGQVLEAVLCQDGLAYLPGLHDGTGLAALADFLQPRGDEACVQSLFAVLSDGCSGEVPPGVIACVAFACFGGIVSFITKLTYDQNSFNIN